MKHFHSGQRVRVKRGSYSSAGVVVLTGVSAADGSLRVLVQFGEGLSAHFRWYAPGDILP